MTKTIERMKSNAKSCNIHLTDEYLNELTPSRLLCFTHPLERRDFADELRKAGVYVQEIIETEEEI